VSQLLKLSVGVWLFSNVSRLSAIKPPGDTWHITGLRNVSVHSPGFMMCDDRSR